MRSDGSRIDNQEYQEFRPSVAKQDNERFHTVLPGCYGYYIYIYIYIYTVSHTANSQIISTWIQVHTKAGRQLYYFVKYVLKCNKI